VSDARVELARLIKPGGHVIRFGWNSNGFGKRLGFKVIEILLVQHGGLSHDTIATVERRDTTPFPTMISRRGQMIAI
jgi:hypothetical protein